MLRLGAYRFSWFWLALIAVMAVGTLLRLHGIHSPLLDHPNWRQGDTASIARNFATLQYNILYPQTNYNGPPPNYVELELQIVPFLAATLYKIFGVHEIFGRLITLAFSVATIGIVGLFGRWLFSSWTAGALAAAFFAIFPGAVFYGRSFTPDTTMVFFLTAALYATARFLVEDEVMKPRALSRTTALVMLAYLAKPVAVAGMLPIAGMMWERLRAGRTTRPTALLVLLFVPLLVLALYDHAVADHAEWHWASGIMQLHVLPELRAALTPAGFAHKLSLFFDAIGMLRTTMTGTFAMLLAVAGFIAMPWIAVRSRWLIWGWLVGSLAYIYVVVTVERVDYYMYLILPLCALVAGGALAAFARVALSTGGSALPRYALAAIVPLAVVACFADGRNADAAYYHYNKAAYANAKLLDTQLDKGALIVMGHYGPDVLYYINRFGWEEDPVLWTPDDEISAINKGAKYFVSVEDNRLKSNAELCVYLQRFPLANVTSDWPVYQTELSLVNPRGIALWKAFRKAEKAGEGPAFLRAHHVCSTPAASSSHSAKK